MCRLCPYPIFPNLNATDIEASEQDIAQHSRKQGQARFTAPAGSPSARPQAISAAFKSGDAGNWGRNFCRQAMESLEIGNGAKHPEASLEGFTVQSIAMLVLLPIEVWTRRAENTIPRHAFPSSWQL
jgi:hypothetical protein